MSRPGLEPSAIAGIWWSADSPTHQTPGLFAFSRATGASLELLGGLRPDRGVGPRSWSAMATAREPIVFGLTEAGVRITLVDCMLVHSHLLLSAGTLRERYVCHLVFKGIHLHDPLAVTFETSLLKLSHLDDWATLSGFTGSITYSADNRLQRYDCSFTWPQEYQAESGEGVLSVTYRFHHKINEHWSERHLKQGTLLRFSPSRPVTLGEYLRRFVRPMEQFLSLAVGRRTFVTSLELQLATPQTVRTGDTGSGGSIGWVEALFDEGLRSIDEERLTMDQMLFTLSDIESRFSETIRAAFEIANRYRGALNAFISVYYDIGMLGEQRFLDLARAAESLHREDRGRDELDEPAHASRLERIVRAAPEEDREWLRERLQHSNDASFRSRLKDLIAEVEPLVQPLLLPKKASAIDQIVAARNSLTHLDSSGSQEEPDLKRLFQLSEILGVLVEGVLLRRLGFSLDEILQLHRNSQRYQMALSRAIHDV